MPQKIQSMLFDVKKWTVEEAKAWLGKHDMRHDKVDTTEENHRFRQFDPSECSGGFQTLTESFPDGVKAVSCEAKSASLMEKRIVSGEPGADHEPGAEHEPAITKPPELERCVEHLMDQGHSEDSAYAICNSVMGIFMHEEASAKPAISEIREAVPVRKFYQAEMKALKNGDVESYVSTETIDRVGDIIRAKGWNIENYIKTGAPVLFSHDYNLPPIGKSVQMEKQRKGLWSITRFHEKTQLSRDLALLARDGDMKSWSVGFSAMEPPESRTEDGVFKGYIFNKTELLEYSLVAVPANPEAVSKAIHLMHEGKISKQTAYIFAGPSPLSDEGVRKEDDKGRNAAAVQALVKGLHARAALLALRTGARK